MIARKKRDPFQHTALDKNVEFRFSNHLYFTMTTSLDYSIRRQLYLAVSAWMDH